MQNVIQEEDNIFSVLPDYIDKSIIQRRNATKSWKYGYDEKYDVVIISKNGEIGEIYKIQNLIIALPKEPKSIYSRSKKREDQYWEREIPPPELSRIKSMSQWNDAPAAFKNNWLPYIDQQFDCREHGFWFKNNGVSTYLTGQHWFYLQVASIDVGYPDFREANRIKYIHWEACKADDRSIVAVILDMFLYPWVETTLPELKVTLESVITGSTTGLHQLQVQSFSNVTL